MDEGYSGVSVTIHVDHENEKVLVSQAALDRVRASFNPSDKPRVDRIKLLAAALISEIEDGPSSREAALAVTNIEQGAMWAVKAATA